MNQQDIRMLLLGTARSEPYLAAASGDLDKAFDLYLWATEVSGVVHAQLSFVEVAVRNSLDEVIADWNSTQGDSFAREWCLEDHTSLQLFNLLRKPLLDARRNAGRAAEARGEDHPRHGISPTHDDVLAQMTFGNWSTLIAGQPGDTARQAQFWKDATHQAFPGLSDAESSRAWIGHQLDELRTLRNRVSHYDSILHINLTKRLRSILSVLAKIDKEIPSLATARSPLRRLIREDPRRTWNT